MGVTSTFWGTYGITLSKNRTVCVCFWLTFCEIDAKTVGLGFGSGTRAFAKFWNGRSYFSNVAIVAFTASAFCADGCAGWIGLYAATRTTSLTFRSNAVTGGSRYGCSRASTNGDATAARLTTDAFFLPVSQRTLSDYRTAKTDRNNSFASANGATVRCAFAFVARARFACFSGEIAASFFGGGSTTRTRFG